MTSQATTSTLGNVEAAYSASAVSSNVAAASGHAALLKADPSNKSKARAAQKSTHDSLNLALDLFHRSHGSSPFGRALSALISILTKASCVADAAVDASTPDDEEQDAEELVSDLEEAAQDAELVEEEEDNDDDETTTTTTTTSTTSITSTSSDSQRRTEISSRSPTSALFTSSSISSSVTSSAPTAGPSACTLSFDILGDEDIEVGDDGYDSSTGDNVGCVPVIGAGGVASGCGSGGPSTWPETSSKGLSAVSTSTLYASSAVAPTIIPNGPPKPSSQIPSNTPSTTSTLLSSSAVAPIIIIPNGEPTPSSQVPANTSSTTTSLSTTANLTSSTPIILATVIVTTTPHYPVTTILVLITTFLPPPGRRTVYSTVYVDAPSPSTTTTTTTTANSSVRDPLSPITCTNDFSNVDDSLCWGNCFGGTCDVHTNPFLNSEPWYVCSGCP